MVETAASVVPEIQPASDRPDNPLPRNVSPELMVVEIDSRPAAYVIPAGIIVYRGAQRYRLPKYHLPMLMAQVMTDRDRAEMKRYTELHEKKLTAYIDEHAGKLEGVERQLKEQELRGRYAGSPEALFHRDNPDHPLPPFNRVDLIEDGLPPPVDEAAKARAEETAKLVMAAVGGTKTSGEDMSAAIATGVSAAIEALISKGVLSVNRQQNDQKR
jgi:hypothetical protein